MMESEKNTLFFKMRTTDISEPVLAMAFVNMQPLERLYSLDEAYKSGTLFEDLNKPYLGGNPNEKW